MKHIFGTLTGKTDCVISFFSEDIPTQHPFIDILEESDAQYCGSVMRSMKNEAEIKCILLPEAQTNICLMCLGDKKSWGGRKLILASRKVFQAVKSAKFKNVSILIDDYLFADCSLERVAESLATNAEMATYEFIRYKEVPPDGWPEIELVTYCARDAALKKNIIRAIETGSIIGQEVNMARELSNIPGGDMTPKMLANEAKKRALSAGVTVTILGEKDMKALKMGGILAVSRGSTEEAQLIVMEYRNGPKTKKPYVFVGKGVTFDSGGLHLKPSNAMDEMHMDMSGGASVIAAVTALARMHARVNVIGIIPAAENMPSGESFRPGDVLMSMLGKTVEVVSPDAEGRVIVADALTYAERYKPELVIDVATLTGAVVVALGHHASALFATSDGLSDALCAAAEASGDYVWPLPLWSEYEADIKGVTGDILNAPKNREAGCINGAIFLSQFAKEFPHWAHVDIASTMTGSPDQALSKGSSGSGTRLLIEVGRNYGKIV